MSFQAYLTNIEARTGMRPDDFRAHAASRQWLEGDALRGDVKAGTVVADLKQAFGLGHGHAMAIYALLKGTKKEGDA